METQCWFTLFDRRGSPLKAAFHLFNGRRAPTSLHTYLVERNEAHLGTVLTRRIKADHGAIEIALALDPDRRVRGLKIQRIREPEELVRTLSKDELES